MSPSTNDAPIEGSESSDAAADDQLRQQVADFHDRLRLTNVRLQRLNAETMTEPPLAVASVTVVAEPSEILLEGSRFASRFTQTVTLHDSEETVLAQVGVTLEVDFTVDDGPEPSERVLDTYARYNCYFIAHPYLRETIASASLRLGIEPIVLGVLNRDETRPAEVALVSRVNVPV